MYGPHSLDFRTLDFRSLDSWSTCWDEWSTNIYSPNILQGNVAVNYRIQDR